MMCEIKPHTQSITCCFYGHGAKVVKIGHKKDDTQR
jgi:hypothetical protein